MVKEGRLSRWARLKQKGGADEKEETSARSDLEQKIQTLPDDGGRIARSGDDIMIAPEPTSLPGGDFRHNAVPVMAPLAGGDEEDTGFEQAPIEAMVLLDGEVAHDAALAVPPVDGFVGAIDEQERELSEEEQTIVDELPTLDSLTKESDFTPFLADKVPEFIRRRAMSVLWRSDPILANLDGMNDYDEDYNIIDTLIDIAKDSTYKVGKGYAYEEPDEESDENDDDEVDSISDAEQTVAEDGNSQSDQEIAEGDRQTQENEGEETQDADVEDETELSPEREFSIRDVRKPEE